MKKKILALLLSTTMIAALAGCGSKTEPVTEEPATEESSEEEEAITATILVWSPAEDQAAEQGNWLSTMCEQFAAEHPNWDITFEYGICPEGDAKTNVTQDVEGAADVYMYANDNIIDLIAANGLAKLGGSTADYVKNTNSQAIIDSVSVDGDIYGIPFTTNTWFMYYDTSRFTEEEAGSLDAMLAKDKISFPLSNSWYIASFYVANGCTLFGDGTDEVAGIDFGGEKGAAVTKYLVETAGNTNFVNDADGSGMAGLRDGSVAALFSGSWDYANVKEILGDNFAAKALPTITIDGAEKQMMAFAGSKAIGVNPNAENMEVAVALAKYLGSAEAQKSHYELRSIVPCNTELLADPELQSDMLIVAQNETFDKTSIIQPFVSAMGNYWTPAENMGKAIVSGDVTLDNAEERTEEMNNSLNSSVID
ncbi:extracellular solute-binding protein [Lachnospiraceae bacterium OttesenSCG-928-D06]|nr:extracellular solute-binding protein [Lachnospiraceae bacterium OttesenSCG-928-D06]